MVATVFIGAGVGLSMLDYHLPAALVWGFGGLVLIFGV